MAQDIRGNLIASALLISVATAVFVSAASEMGATALNENPKPKSTKSASPSPTEQKEARPVPATPSPSLTVRMEKVKVKQTVKEFAESKVGAKQFDCLHSLWNHESKWKTKATNPSSGAYGIPQALPGEKMASSGKDWKTNPFTQVKWGLKYIDSRYGTPCNALNHFHRLNWY